MSRLRTYCRCTTVQNYDYDGAMEKLGCKRGWLEDNISRLPHQKFGASPVFCDCELALIQAMFTILPESVIEFLTVPQEAKEEKPTSVLALADIRPIGAGRRATS